MSPTDHFQVISVTSVRPLWTKSLLMAPFVANVKLWPTHKGPSLRLVCSLLPLPPLACSDFLSFPDSANNNLPCVEFKQTMDSGSGLKVSHNLHTQLFAQFEHHSKLLFTWTRKQEEVQHLQEGGSNQAFASCTLRLSRLLLTDPRKKGPSAHLAALAWLHWKLQKHKWGGGGVNGLYCNGCTYGDLQRASSFFCSSVYIKKASNHNLRSVSSKQTKRSLIL